MNEIKIFTNEEFGTVRTVELNGDVWFVAADICDVFNAANRNRLMQRLDEDEKGYTQMDTPGGKQQLAVVNESGLYSLLFAMQPQKTRGVNPEEIEARLEKLSIFKRWVTHEVLPSIRRHGAYMTDNLLAKTLEDPDYMINLLQELKKEREEKKRLAAENATQHEQIALMEPKAEYFDDLVERNLLTNFRETSKEFGIGQKQFIRWLLDHKFLYRDAHGKLMPYAAKNKGYFEVKEYRSEYSQNAGTQTMITPKGRETFRLLIER